MTSYPEDRDLTTKEEAHITEDSFGSMLPADWKIIAEIMNEKIDALEENEYGYIDRYEVDDIWENIERFDYDAEIERRKPHKSFEYQGSTIEISPVRFYYMDEKEDQDGIIVHDSNDQFGDGDAIYGNGWTIESVNDTDDVETLLTSGEGTTNYFKDELGYYHIKA